jgi:hypothetical protein
VKAEGRKPPAKPWHRWEDNIKIDFRELGWDDMDYIHLAQGLDQ